MAKYIIDYDLNKTGKNYDDLIKAIKNYGNYAKVCKSTWVIATDSNTANIRDNLMQHIDSNDYLFVALLEGKWSSYGLPKEVINWLQNH